MKKICFSSFAVCFALYSASAQLSFTSGVDPSANPNGNYAAAQFWNFSNLGGSGKFTSGIGNNLYGADYQTWSQQSFAFSFTYSPVDSYYPNLSEAVATVAGSIGTLISPAPAAPNELQILVGNSGIGDLIVTLTSINSVLTGGTLNGPTAYVFGGTPVPFAAGTTFSAANGTTLQAYLDNPALFASAFTLNGTITLDAPANSTDYGDNFNSLVEFNLTSTPEPSTWALMACGAGLLGAIRHHRKK